MKKKDLASAVIDRVDYPNKGVFHVDETGEEGVVKNVIPGQEVLFRVYKKHGTTVFGNRLEVVKPSPLETRPPLCDHFGRCGGCLYQTVPYADQLRMKEEQIRCLLGPVTDEDTVFDGIKASPMEFEYRNKIDLSFGDEEIGGPLALGMHRTGTRYTVLDAENCALAHPDMRLILKTIRDYCASAGLPFYNKLKHIGYLRYLMLRRSEASGEILAVLATSSQEEHDFGGLAEQLKALPLQGSFAGFHHAICDRVADALLPDEVRCIFGRDYFYEKILGLTFKVTLFSFFQTNTRGAEVLYAAVRDYMETSGIGSPGADGRKPVIYDLYSGTGTIAQLVSKNAEHVYGIEIVSEAVEDARRNAAVNGIENCTFLAGDVPELLGTLPERPDYVILDPPREGVSEKALRQINDYHIPNMVYISCKATSFLRDMVYLRRFGWKMSRFVLVDMFPQTQHVETVVQLSKGNISSEKIRVEFNLEDMDMSKFQQGATYEQIQDWVQEKYGFHVTHLNIAKTKRKCGIIERQNYNLPKREDSRSPETPKEKEEAIIEAFKVFQMIQALDKQD